MRVVSMLVSALVCCVAGALCGYLLGELAPGGIAMFAEPFTPIRDAEAEHFAVLGAGAGLVVGIILGAFVKVGGGTRADAKPEST